MRGTGMFGSTFHIQKGPGTDSANVNNVQESSLPTGSSEKTSLEGISTLVESWPRTLIMHNSCPYTDKPRRTRPIAYLEASRA